MVRLWSNFQGPLNSLQVIFGRVIWTLRPSGSGPDPENGLFRQIYLLPGFWASGSCHTFSETGGQGKQNIGRGILIFYPWPEKTGPPI